MKYLLLMTLSISAVFATSRSDAIQSANNIIQAFSGYGSKQHISDDLRAIARYGHSLPDNIKNDLINLGFNFEGQFVNRSPLDERSEANGLDLSYDSGIFRYHYTLTGNHAVDTADTNGNNIPDYIEQMADVFNVVSSTELTMNNFTEPPGDGWYPLNNDNGGSGLYDIYIRNLSSQLYGYTQPELYANNNGNNEHSDGLTEVNATTSYMVMRNNYNGFPNSLLENIQVTATHEFFHAVQFGYDGWEETWIMEATAVQMEEIVYDNINDCYQYMSSWFHSPHQSLNLDSYNRWYGSFIFFEYVSTHLDPETIRLFWEKSITHDSYYGSFSIQTLDEVFQELGSSFINMLNDMSVANRILTSNSAANPYTYEEADAYSSSPSTFQNVSYSAGVNASVSSTNLQANAAQYIRLISNDPVLATLSSDTGNDGDLMLFAILSYSDSSWTVWSGSPINVDPAGATRIYFVIVSQNSDGSNFNYTLTFTDGQMSTNPDLPKQFTVSNAYPNPFNPETHMIVDLTGNENLNIFIYDMKGRVVTQLINDRLPSGRHFITWNGKDIKGNQIASGMYMIRVMGSHFEHWQKITLLK